MADFGIGAGAVVTFTGLVLAKGGRLTGLEIEHYLGMTDAALAAFGAQAAKRFLLLAWLIVHRHGSLAAGGPIMMIATAARHRKAAFEAAEFLMDWLKSRAPFWKRELTAAGPANGSPPPCRRGGADPQVTTRRVKALPQAAFRFPIAIRRRRSW